MSPHVLRSTDYNKKIDALIAEMIAAAAGLTFAPKVLPPCGHDSQNCRENYCSEKAASAAKAAAEAAAIAAEAAAKQAVAKKHE